VTITLLFRRLMLVAVAGLLLSGVTAAPAARAADTLSIQPVAPGVYAVIGASGNANAGFILTKEGVVIVDSQINPRAAGEMLGAIRTLTARPILYLINTHAHGDHTFADHVIKPTKGIIAHERTRVILASRGAQMLTAYATVVGPKNAEGAQVTIPTITFVDQMTLPIEDRTITLRYLGIGHTVGDIVVWLPRERVLFTGDLVSGESPPLAGRGREPGMAQDAGAAQITAVRTDRAGCGSDRRSAQCRPVRTLPLGFAQRRDHRVSPPAVAGASPADHHAAGVPTRPQIQGMVAPEHRTGLPADGKRTVEWFTVHRSLFTVKNYKNLP
jgi:glyoxylase-like metal-dependent hydrolase (beta-lactamase superfamily II)